MAEKGGGAALLVKSVGEQVKVRGSGAPGDRMKRLCVRVVVWIALLGLSVALVYNVSLYRNAPISVESVTPRTCALEGILSRTARRLRQG